MKLKVAKKKAVKKEKDEVKVRQGKNAKRKGSQYERDIAKMFKEHYGIDLKRTPQSGGFAKKSTLADDFRGDITVVDTTQQLKLHIECKNQKTWSLNKWLDQAESDCPKGRRPIVIMHRHNTSKDYVCLSLQDFMELVEKKEIIERRKLK